jgi:hypothetical protein
MANVPAITLSDNADRTELWNMFWQVGTALHTISDDNLDFGNPKDPSNESKNLQPHKLLFATNNSGHDHGFYGGRRLHPDAVEKRQIDVNATNVLWADYWNDILGGDTSSKLVVLTGLASIDEDFIPDGSSSGYTNAGTTRYVMLQTQPGVTVTNDQNNACALDIDSGSDYDSGYYDGLDYEVIAVVVTAMRGTGSLGIGNLATPWVGKKAGEWLLAVNSQIAGISINYMVIGKYTGPRDGS